MNEALKGNGPTPPPDIKQLKCVGGSYLLVCFYRLKYSGSANGKMMGERSQNLKTQPSKSPQGGPVNFQLEVGSIEFQQVTNG